MKKKYVAKWMIITALSVVTLTACGSEKAENAAVVETVESEEETTSTEEQTTEIEIEAETEAETETEEVESTEETTESQAEYTFRELSAVMYATQSVNVRNTPNTEGEKAGTLALNEEVSVTGQCNETNWYRIEYKGQVAYVSDKYLSDTKVEVVEEANNNANVPQENSEVPVSNAGVNILQPEPEGNYVPTTYVEGGYTYLDLGFMILSTNVEKTTYSDETLANPIGKQRSGEQYGLRQCIETGAIEIKIGPNETTWISSDGVRMGY